MQLVCMEKPKQEVFEKMRKLSRGTEQSEEERAVLAAEGSFFFEMERCVPTAASTTAVMNRLQACDEECDCRSSVRDIGMQTALFSTGDRFVVVSFVGSFIDQVLKENSRPSMLWIWDVKRDCLTANLVFVTPVIAVSWNPVKDQLAIITSSQTLYFWEAGSIVWSLLPNSIGWDE